MELGSGLFNSCFIIHLKVLREAYFVGVLFNFILFLGSVFLFETVFVHLNCLLSCVAKDDEDGH